MSVTAIREGSRLWFTLAAAEGRARVCQPARRATAYLNCRCATRTAARRVDELTCRAGSPASLFARALPAGRYFVSWARPGRATSTFSSEVARTQRPRMTGCANPPALVLGETLDLSLADHADAVNLGCLPGAPDSAHSLTLTAPSDILLVGGSSNADTVAVGLAESNCAAARLACGLSSDADRRDASLHRGARSCLRGARWDVSRGRRERGR